MINSDGMKNCGAIYLVLSPSIVHVQHTQDSRAFISKSKQVDVLRQTVKDVPNNQLIPKPQDPAGTNFFSYLH